MRTAPLWVLVGLAAIVVAGCGQKGPLVLPDAQHPRKKAKLPAQHSAPATPPPTVPAPAPAAPAGATPTTAPPEAAPGTNSTPNPAPQR